MCVVKMCFVSSGITHLYTDQSLEFYFTTTSVIIRIIVSKVNPGYLSHLQFISTFPVHRESVLNDENKKVYDSDQWSGFVVFITRIHEPDLRVT